MMKMKMKRYALLISFLLCAPLVQAQEHRTTTVTSTTKRNEANNQRNSRWNESVDGNELSIMIRGDVRFNDDYTDVVSVADGSFFQIKEKRDGMARQIEISRQDNGELQRRYTVQGGAHEYDREARSQFTRMLAVAISHGFDIEARARRVLRERGAGAVLNEAAQARNDYARKVWLTTLTEAGNLDTDLQHRLMNLVASQMSSDYERAEVLMRTARFDYGEKALRSAFTEVVEKMTSDYERGRVLKALLRQQKNQPELLLLAVKSAAIFSSDYEKAQLLIHASKTSPVDAALRPALVDAAQTINSDYERGRVLAVLFHERERN